MPELAWHRWLRRCWAKLAQRERPVRRKLILRARPQLEELEGRFVPSTFIVDNPTDTPIPGMTDLREAITSANANGQANTISFDTIVFSTPQTITLTGLQLELSNTSGMQTIVGPAAGVTISGNNASRVFLIDPNVSAAISGVTITGGNGAGNGGDGGGVQILEGTLALTNCTISGNTAQGEGGGLVMSSSAKLTMTNCTVTGNTTYLRGAGGLWSDGTLTLTNCTISNNTGLAGSGAGLTNAGGTASLTGCTVSGNSASNSAGGLYSYNGTTTLTGCTVSGNTATNGAGGIFANGGTATLTNSTISGNTANDGAGGGIATNSGGTATLSDCTVSANTAFGDGFRSSRRGGLVPDGSGAGGGISGDGFTIANTIIAGNSAQVTAPDASASVTSLGNNLIGATDGSSGWVSSDRTGTSAAPLDPLLALLDNYGGPTQTMALLPGSPAIGAGSVALIPADITTDQRGVSRLYNGRVDIGAFQFIAAAPTVTAGDGQTGPIDAAFAVPLTVTLADTTNHPIVGAAVVFMAPLAGPSATFGGQSSMTAITGADGRATVIALANGLIGSYKITASVADVSGLDTFSLTNSAIGLPTISGASSVQAGDPYDLELDPTLNFRDGISQNQGIVSVTAWHINFGDGTPIVDVAGDVADVPHTFSNAPNNLKITATATLSNGILVPAGTTVLVDVLTPQLAAIATTHASSSEQVTLNIPGDVNVAATLIVAAGETRDLTFFIGTYDANPAQVDINSATFFEVRVSATLNGQPLSTIPEGTFVDVTFHTPPVPLDYQLLYLDPVQNVYVPAQSGPLPPGVPPSDPAQGLFTIALNRNSLPAVTGLGGTVFTVALPPSTIPPAPVTSTLASALPAQVQPASTESMAETDVEIISGGFGDAGGGSGSRIVFNVNAVHDSSTTAVGAQANHADSLTAAVGGPEESSDSTRGNSIAGDNRTSGQKAADTAFELINKMKTATDVIFGGFLKPFGFGMESAIPPPPVTDAVASADDREELHDEDHALGERAQPLPVEVLAADQMNFVQAPGTASLEAPAGTLPRAAAIIGLLGQGVPLASDQFRRERRSSHLSRGTRTFDAPY